MKPISYNVPLITQGESECVQASASQILAFYGIKKTIEEIKNEVPILRSQDGELIGTSWAHIALYFLELGFDVTFHTTDVVIFDRTWKDLEKEKILAKLEQRQPHLTHAFYTRDVLDLYFDGYSKFLKQGGTIRLPVITNNYLYKLLEKGPIVASVDYQFLNEVSKWSYDAKTDQWKEDDISGIPLTHAIIISGYHDGAYTIVDPDYRFGGVRTIDCDHLLGAFYLAQFGFDNILITLRPIEK